MWRALFLAIGIVLCILGGECLLVEKAVLAQHKDAEAPAPTAFMSPDAAPPPKEISPPEWAPWSLLSAGAVVLLYSYTLPRRGS
jgi:hypothetical protein